MVRGLKYIVLAVALGVGSAGCTSKEPVVDTALTPPTDPGTGMPTYSGGGPNSRRVERGWRLVFEADPTVDTGVKLSR